jgi:uncharacterized protein with PIN domain
VISEQIASVIDERRAARVPEAVAKARAFAASVLPLLEQFEALAAKAGREGEALDEVFCEKTLMSGAGFTSYAEAGEAIGALRFFQGRDGKVFAKAVERFRRVAVRLNA